MKIDISRAFAKPLRKHLRNAVQITALHYPIAADQEIEIRPIKKAFRKQACGFTYALGNTIVVELNPKEDLLEILDTIYHESVHIHQMSQGYLKINANGIISWKGWLHIPLNVYNMNIVHRNTPWERQAIKFAAKMTKEILEFCDDPVKILEAFQ